MAEQTLQNIRDSFSLTTSNNFKSALGNDIADIYHMIQEAQKAITQVAQDREEANQPDKVSALDETFKEFVILNNQATTSKNAMDTVKQRINNGEKIADPVAYYENLMSTLNNNSGDEQSRINTNEKYLSFRQQIWNVNHPDEMMPSLNSNNDDDDDLVMGPTRISLKCPITTVWLEEPVTSTKCKHTYSKKAIYSLFPSYSHAIVCPIPGCEKTVTRSDLVGDPVMADRVTRAKNREVETDETIFFDV